MAFLSGAPYSPLSDVDSDLQTEGTLLQQPQDNAAGLSITAPGQFASTQTYNPSSKFAAGKNASTKGGSLFTIALIAVGVYLLVR